MLPDRVSNPGPLTYESGALPIALRGPSEREGGERERESHREGEMNTVLLTPLNFSNQLFCS